MKVVLFVEGGGDSKVLHSECRKGFRKLLEQAGFHGRMPRIVSCGSRKSAYDDFMTALRHVVSNEYPILLVDSEALVNQELNAWAHLQARDNWRRPKNVNDDQAQLMVQCMETWLIADQPTLMEFFGQYFNPNSLPPLFDLEARGKADIQNALEAATRNCGRSKSYAKGKRSFELLGRLNPTELRKYLPHFDRFCKVLMSKLPSIRLSE